MAGRRSSRTSRCRSTQSRRYPSPNSQRPRRISTCGCPPRFNREGIGVRVARAWGFGVVSEIVWDKITFGLGKFPRPQHEILLVCRRGSLPFQVNNAGSVQRWRAPRAKGSRGRIHSAKPDGSYDLIEQASPGPYAELFARRARFGWDYPIGDQSLSGVAA